MKTNIRIILSYFAQFFLDCETSLTKLVEKIKTRLFILNNFFMFNRAVDEIMWKNMVEPGRPQVTLRRIHILCWIPKSTNTYSEYVILSVFPLQQWLQERLSLLHIA